MSPRCFVGSLSLFPGGMETQGHLFNFIFLNTILGINTCCSCLNMALVDRLICVVKSICAGKEGVRVTLSGSAH